MGEAAERAPLIGQRQQLLALRLIGCASRRLFAGPCLREAHGGIDRAVRRTVVVTAAVAKAAVLSTPIHSHVPSLGGDGGAVLDPDQISARPENPPRRGLFTRRGAAGAFDPLGDTPKLIRASEQMVAVPEMIRSLGGAPENGGAVAQFVFAVHGLPDGTRCVSAAQQPRRPAVLRRGKWPRSRAAPRRRGGCDRRASSISSPTARRLRRRACRRRPIVRLCPCLRASRTAPWS